MSPLPVTPEQLAALPPEFRALLQAVIDHYEKRIAELEQKVADLESRLKTSPRNSSLPPSSEHPHAKPTPTEKPAGKKRGGQPGHPQHERKLIPTELCHAVHTLKPRRCRGCGLRLTGSDPDPRRHQVFELPQPEPIITEYIRHRLTCAGCGQTTCAELPLGVPDHTAGPRLIAVTSVLMALFRQSKRRTALALTELFGVPASPGWVVKLQGIAAAAIAPSYQELMAALPQTPVANCDETATKEGPHKAWLWTVVTSAFTVFAIRLTRAGCVIESLLGAGYPGVVGCDRYAGYNAFNARRQICWAHLKRDFQAMIDAGGQAKQIGDRLMKHLHLVFDHWHGYRAGKITRRTMQANIRKLHWPIWETLEDGEQCPHAPTVATCRDLHQRFDQLWMFCDHPGVEPTNNAAERALRHAVIWRKLSFGTQSAAGSRFVESMLSVIATCRQQHRNPLDYLTATLEAAQFHEPPPLLLNGA